MRQRAMIAMALVHNPDVLIADEPTTALDVTVQAQILELIDRVKREFDVGVILITHDLGVVAETASHVLVMYGGRAMEYGPAQRDLQRAPSTPTPGACSSRCRRSSGAWTMLVPIEGSPPSLLAPAARLPVPPALPLPLRAAATQDVPPLERCPSGHLDACFLPAERKREEWQQRVAATLGRRLVSDHASARRRRRRSSSSST